MMPKPEGLSLKADGIRQRMEKAQKLLSLFQADGWIAMMEWLDAEIARTTERICHPEISPETTMLLRGQVWTLKTLRSLPSLTQQEIEVILAESKGLQARLEKLHTRRPTEYKDTLETVNQITRT